MVSSFERKHLLAQKRKFAINHMHAIFIYDWNFEPTLLNVSF